MITLNVQHLKNNYINWYQSQVDFKKINSHTLRIEIPFKDCTMDNIILYVIFNDDKQTITLSDDGYTLFNLKSQKAELFEQTSTLKLLYKYIQSFNVNLDKSTEEIYNECAIQNLNEALQSFAQSIIHINDLLNNKKIEIQNFSLKDTTNDCLSSNHLFL
ncbi:DUF1828 domain-containing protein [Staphylococcus simulans]